MCAACSGVSSRDANTGDDLLSSSSSSDSQERADGVAGNAEQIMSQPEFEAFDVDDGSHTEESAVQSSVAVATEDNDSEVATEPEEESVPAVAIQLRAGENLGDVASWGGLKVEELAQRNGIRVNDTVFPGQTLFIPMADGVDEASILEAREQLLTHRLEMFVERRDGLLGVTTREVGTGESAWNIAKTEGNLPHWVLAAYNDDLNLNELRVGDTLIIPVMGDTITALIEAEEEPAQEHFELAGVH